MVFEDCELMASVHGIWAQSVCDWLSWSERVSLRDGNARAIHRLRFNLILPSSDLNDFPMIGWSFVQDLVQLPYYVLNMFVLKKRFSSTSVSCLCVCVIFGLFGPECFAARTTGKTMHILTGLYVIGSVSGVSTCIFVAWHRSGPTYTRKQVSFGISYIKWVKTCKLRLWSELVL